MAECILSATEGVSSAESAGAVRNVRLGSSKHQLEAARLKPKGRATAEDGLYETSAW